MANVPNGVETLLKISIAWVVCTNITDDRQKTDDRQTDGRRHIANMNISSRFLKTILFITCDCKANHILPIGIRVQPDLQVIGFNHKDISQCSTPSNMTWLFTIITFVLTSIFMVFQRWHLSGNMKRKFHKLCADHGNFSWIYANSLKIGDKSYLSITFSGVLLVYLATK